MQKTSMRPRMPVALLIAACATAVAFTGLASGGPRGSTGERGRADPVVELGRRLFFDPAVSRSGHNSCASCHDPAHGFSSDRAREDDDFSPTRRRSQTLVDAVLGRSFHWDGEFDRVEDLVNARLGAPRTRRGTVAGEAVAAGPEARGSSYGGPNGTPPTSMPPPASGGTPTYGSGGGTTGSGDGSGSGDPAAAGSDGWEEPPAKPTEAPPADGAPPADPAEPAKSGYGSDTGGTSDTGGKEVYGSGNGNNSSCTPGCKRPQGAVYSGKRTPEDPAPKEPSDPTDPGDGATPTTPSNGGPSSGSGSAAGSGSTGGSSGGSTPIEGGSTPPSGAGTPAWLGGDTPPDELPPTIEPDSKDPARGVTLVADRVDRDGRYATAFVLAFGTPHVTTARLARAISAFVESIRSTESAFDRFAAGDAHALSAPARRGLALFRGRAACTSCHAMEGARPTFTDGRFHVTGVAMRTSVTRPVEGADGLLTRAPYDAGRFLTTDNRKETGAFKTPTLRDVASRAPYMHDGSLASLDDVIRHYAKGAFTDPNLDPVLRGFDATADDVADLRAFLESLSSETRPGAAPAWPARASTQMVRFLDARGRPLAGLRVRIVPAGDGLPGAVTPAASDRVVTSDAKGMISFAPTRGTHARLDLPDGLRMPQGALVPDTCPSLTVRLPVDGTTTLVVSSPVDGVPLSKVAAVTAPTALSLSMFRALRRFAPEWAESICRRSTTFQAEGSVVVAGRRLTRYRAWVPAGSAERALVEVPTATSRGVFEVRLADGDETRIDAVR